MIILALYQNILSNECKKYVKVVIKHLIYKYTNAVKSETKKHTICTSNTKKEGILVCSLLYNLAITLSNDTSHAVST